MTTTRPTKLNTADMAYIALFAVAIAICSWISVPATVPFTLQTFGVFLAAAVLVYLALGMAGVPVFAGFQGGMGCLLGSTGGYLIGFLFLALVMWAGERLSGGRRWALALSMALGLLVCYAFGTAWFMAVYARTTGQIGLWTALSWCVFPFVLPDAAKLALALVLSRRLAAAVRLR